jgi:hypothetical protein
MNIGHMQEVGASLCDAVLQFSIAENLIKDVLIVPQTVKTKNRAESVKMESDIYLKESRDGRDVTCVGTLRDMTREMRDVGELEQHREGAGGHRRSERKEREKKLGTLSLTLTSMNTTSYTILSDISAASGSTADDLAKRSPAMDGKPSLLRYQTLHFLCCTLSTPFYSTLLYSLLQYTRTYTTSMRRSAVESHMLVTLRVFLYCITTPHYFSFDCRTAWRFLHDCIFVNYILLILWATV